MSSEFSKKDVSLIRRERTLSTPRSLSCRVVVCQGHGWDKSLPISSVIWEAPERGNELLKRLAEVLTAFSIKELYVYEDLQVVEGFHYKRLT